MMVRRVRLVCRGSRVLPVLTVLTALMVYRDLKGRRVRLVRRGCRVWMGPRGLRAGLGLRVLTVRPVRRVLVCLAAARFGRFCRSWMRLISTRSGPTLG